MSTNLSKNSTSNAEASTSAMAQFNQYLKGVRTEWTKISWPTTQQIIGQTIVVLAVVSIMTVGLFVIDYGFHTLISLITPPRG